MRGAANLRAYLRQVGGLGLDPLLFMPEWLAAAGRGLGADGVACVWLDEAQRPADVYAPDLAERDLHRLASCLQCLASVDSVGDASASVAGQDAVDGITLPAETCGRCTVGWWGKLHRAGHGADLSRWLMRAGGFDDVLDGWVGLPGGGALLVLLLRRASTCQFDAADRHQFVWMTNDLAAGRAAPGTMATSTDGLEMASNDAVETGFAGTVAEGTLVMREGMPEWLDAEAHRLLNARLQVRPGGAWPDIAPLAVVCRELALEVSSVPMEGVSEDASGGSILGPGQAMERWVLVPGGRVTLRAMRLRSPGGTFTDRVGVTLRHQPPRALVLLRQLGATPLSPLQREVAYRLACGQSRGEIRDACAMGVETLKTHIAQIRARLHPDDDAALLSAVGLTTGALPAAL